MYMCTFLLYLLPSHVATAAGLELDDDLGELQISLLLQLSQYPGPEEHLGVSDAIGGRVKVQCLHLGDKAVGIRGKEEGKGEGVTY